MNFKKNSIRLYFMIINIVLTNQCENNRNNSNKWGMFVGDVMEI